MTRWGGVMRPNPSNYSMNLPRWTGIWAGDYNSEWVQRWSLCALRVHTYQCTWLQWAMQTPLAWPRYAHSSDQNTSTSNQSTKLKRQTGGTNASSNTSYRQETSKDSAVDRVGRRGSLSSPQRTEHSGSPVLNERDRSACQLDARKAAHYFLLHHQTVAYSWRPRAGSPAAKTPTFQYRLVVFRRLFDVFDAAPTSLSRTWELLLIGIPAGITEIITSTERI